jgi:serine/threonine protein phosphatase PrpC
VFTNVCDGKEDQKRITEEYNSYISGLSIMGHNGSLGMGRITRCFGSSQTRNMSGEKVLKPDPFVQVYETKSVSRIMLSTDGIMYCHYDDKVQRVLSKGWSKKKTLNRLMQFERTPAAGSVSCIIIDLKRN